MGRRWSVRYKKLVLDYAEGIGSDVKSYRDFDVPKSTFYEWKKAFKKEGAVGLIPKKPISRHHPRQLSSEVIEKILHLRSKYHFGPQRIVWYLERYHGMTVSCSSVYLTLACNGLPSLPATWHAQAPEPSWTAGRTHAPLREAGSRPSRAGRREVPDFQGCSG